MIEWRDWQLVDGAQNTITLEQWFDLRNKLALLPYFEFGKLIGIGIARGIQPSYRHIMRRKIRRYIQSKV